MRDDRARRGATAERGDFAAIAAHHARDLILVLDSDQRILWASPSYRDVLGHDPASMIGRRSIDYIHRDDHERQHEAHRHRVSKGATTIVEVRLLHSDGSSLEVENVGVPVVDGDGKVRQIVVTARDIRERKNLDRRLRLLLEQIPANVWTTDRKLNITSSAGRAVSDDFMSAAVDVHERVLRGEPVAFETRWRERDLHVRMHPLRNEHNEIVGTIGITLDVTEQRQAERRFKLLFERNVAGVFRSTVAGKLVECNEAFARMFGYDSPAQMNGVTTPSLYFNAGDRQALLSLLRVRGEATNFEVRLRRRDGKPVWVLLNEFMQTSPDSGEETLEGTAVDITARKLAEERIEYQAYHDSLTDLPNRFLLNDRLARALAQARRHNHAVAVLFLDLDHFKTINDSMAHSAGDELLRGVAARLHSGLRAEDTVARIGGDEFVFILAHVDHNTAASAAAKVAEKLLDALSHPFIVQGRELFVTASIGIAISPHDGEDIETLVKNADSAMYRAKELGRNNYQFNTPLAQRRAELRLTLETALRRAIGRDELFLLYQPIIDTTTSRITAFEALLRWRRPDGGILEPKDFIPLAEEIGAIVPIGEWVFWTACRQLRQWQSAIAPDLRLSINLSPRQFQDDGLTRMVEDVLAETGVGAQSVDIEVTESLSVRDSDLTMGRLSHFRSIGLGVALDDFGTGYSSLGQLRFMPITALKIDRSFICDLRGIGRERTIVDAIITMGHALGLRIIGEGVEREEQRVILRELGCDEMQGFAFHVPLAVDAAGKLLHP